MKKKLVSLLLIMTMVLSLVACGSKKEATSSDSIDKVVEKVASFDVQQVDMEGSITGKVEGETLDYTGKMIVSKIGDKSAAIELQYKKDGNYTTVTTMYVTDKALYVNLKQALDFMGTISSQYKILSNYITLSSDYVTVTYEEMIQYMQAYGVDTSEISLDGLTNQASVDSKESMKSGINFLKDLADKSGVAFLSAKDDTLNFDISSDNLEKIFTALSEMDIASYISQYAPQMITGSNDEFNTNFKSQMNEAKESLTQDGLKMTMNGSIKPEGKSGEMTDKLSFKMSATDSTTDTVEMNMTATYYEKGTASYTVPTNAATLTELMTLLSQLGIF